MNRDMVIRSFLSKPKSVPILLAVYSTGFDDLEKRHLYTFEQPNRKESESSVAVPSTRLFCSRKAHYASASKGACRYGMPSMFSSYITYSLYSV